MAETKKKYTIEELYHLFTLTNQFLTEASANVRDNNKPMPADVARYNFYSELYNRLKKEVENKLKEVHDELA